MAKKTSQQQKENNTKSDELENELEQLLNDNQHIRVFFSGRANELMNLHDEFREVFNKYIFISSSGGIGKTKLLKNILENYATNDQDIGIIDLFNPLQISTEQAKASERNAKSLKEQKEALQALLESASKSKRSLILFDTAEPVEKYSVQKSLSAWSNNTNKNTFVLRSISQFTKDDLTPKFLLECVAPYINAVSEIQYIIDEINNSVPHEIKVRSITQNSPISVNLEGAPEAVKLVQESITPWRRKHAEMMAHLIEQEKVAEIEIRKAEILEKRSNAAKTRAEAEKTASDAAQQREQTEKIKLENEKLRLELHRQKIQLAFDILEKISPHMQDTDKTIYLIKLLPHLNTILESPVEMDKNSG